MAPYSRTQTFDELVVTTLDAYMPSMNDNIFKSNSTYYEMRNAGAFIGQDGGLAIVEPLMYGKTAVQAYSRYDALNVIAAEGITGAVYPWAQIATPIMIDRLSERQNSGKYQIIVLLTAKITQAEMSLIEKTNEKLYEAGKYNESQTSLWPAGLLAFVSETPDTYSVGGISSSTDTWWQNKVRGNAGVTWTWIPDLGDTPADATGVAAMRTLYNNCAKGAGGPPTFAVGTQYWFENYEAHLSPFKRYQNDDSAQAGFSNLKYRNMTLYWDEYYRAGNVANEAATLTTASFTFLNVKFIKFRYDTQTNLIRTPFVRPSNQDAKVAHILLYGNMTCGNRRKQGIGTDANITAIN